MNNHSHSHNFVFKYNKIGGINEDQSITFNSNTKLIEIKSKSGSPRRRILSDEEEHKLIDAFESGDFFRSRNYFLPLEGSDSILYILIGFKENEINSCIWSKISIDVPQSLVELIETIENVVKT